MPTYTQTIGGKTYSFDSPTELSPAEQQQEATIFYMEDTQGERTNLANKSATPTQDEQAYSDKKNHSMWSGLEGGAEDFMYGLAKPFTQNPWETTKDVVLRPMRDEAQKAANERRSGNYGRMFAHDTAAAIPVLGPFAAKIGEELNAGVDDPEQLGRATFDSALLFGPKVGEAVVKHGGSAAEMGRGFAAKHPGMIPAALGAAEEYHRSGGSIPHAIGGALLGGNLRNILKDAAKGIAEGKAEGESAAVETGEVASGEAPSTSAKSSAKPKSPYRGEKRPSNATDDAMASPEIQKILEEQHQSHLSKLPNAESVPGVGKNTDTPSMRPVASHATSPDYLKQDVTAWKPGAKFNPNKTLSLPGKGTQSTHLLRGDESVMGLARELGLDIPDSGFDKYPQPEGNAAAAQALRQRASINGQRPRTRPKPVR